MKKRYDDCKKKYTKNYGGRQKRKQYQQEYEYREEMISNALFDIIFSSY